MNARLGALVDLPMFAGDEAIRAALFGRAANDPAARALYTAILREPQFPIPEPVTGLRYVPAVLDHIERREAAKRAMQGMKPWNKTASKRQA